MKKTDISIKNDADFLRARLKGEPLPDSLSEENTVALLQGKRQKRPARKIIKRCISGAVAACLVITGFFVYDYGVYSPVKTTDNNGNAVYAESYGQIKGMIADYLKSEDFRYYFGDFVMYNDKIATGTDALPGDSMFEENAGSDSIVSGSDNLNGHAQTNTQVSGIDEADIVKTDGEYIYVSTGTYVVLVKALSEGKMETTGVIDIAADAKFSEDAYVRVNDMFLYQNMLVLNISVSEIDSDGYTGVYKCGIAVFDITDKTAPALLKTYLQDGMYVSSRVVGSSLLIVSSYGASYGYDMLPAVSDEVLPGVYTSEEKDIKTNIPAGDIVIANSAKPDTFSIVSKIRLDDLTAEPGTLAMLGGGATVYCSEKTLYTAVGVYDYSRATSRASFNEKTNLMSFDITGEKPVFKASGSIEGQLLNNFSLDEYNGYLRAAAHLSDNTNCLYVMDENLAVTGKITKLAEGESIRSVRFMGNTGYIVTFLQTDPLFVIDLSDPQNPEVKGELKIPGFSAYLHPVGEGLMLGVGYGGSETGLDGSAKISLFDVTDPTAPKELDNMIFENTEFTVDYKAFTSVGDGSYIIPAYSWSLEYYEDAQTGTSSVISRNGAVRIQIENGKIKLLTSYLDAEDYFERATYIGNVVYLVNGATPKIISFDMQSGSRLSQWEDPAHGERYWEYTYSYAIVD